MIHHESWVSWKTDPLPVCRGWPGLSKGQDGHLHEDVGHGHSHTTSYCKWKKILVKD